MLGTAASAGAAAGSGDGLEKIDRNIENHASRTLLSKERGGRASDGRASGKQGDAEERVLPTRLGTARSGRDVVDDGVEERIEPTRAGATSIGRGDMTPESKADIRPTLRKNVTGRPTSQHARKESFIGSDADPDRQTDYEAVAYEVRAMLNPIQRDSASHWDSVRDILVSSRSKVKGGGEANPKFTDIYNQVSTLSAAVQAIDKDDAAAVRSALASCSRSRLRELLTADERCDLLFYAVSGEKSEAVESLVALGGDELVLHSRVSNPRTMSTETCLHVAVRCGNLRIVRALVEGLSRDASEQLIMKETVVVTERDDKLSVSAIHIAAMHGHVRLIDYLVTERQVPVDLPCSTRATALCLAALQNKSEAVQRLLALNARANVVDRAQMTFLHYAILSGDKDMVMLCLKSSHHKTCIDQWQQSNPLVLAVFEDKLDIVSVLLEAEEIRALVNVPTRTFGYTALHIACREGKDSTAAICKALLACGADPLVSNKQGETAFATAVANKKVAAMVTLAKYFSPPRRRYFQSVSTIGHSLWDYAMDTGSREVLIALLEIAQHAYQAENSNEDTNTTIDLSTFVALDTEPPFTTPLHIAVKKGDTEHLQLLLKYMSPAAVDANGDTFLHVAARQGHESVLKHFAVEPEMVNKVNFAGDTVLHAACEAHQWACVRILLPLSDTSAVNKLGQTALHELCKNCTAVNYALLKDVIRKTTDDTWDKLALRDKDGQTALHLLAAQDIQDGSVEKLFKLFQSTELEAPLLCNIPNNEGNTPIHVAVSLGRTTNLKAMLSAFRASADVNSMNGMGRTPLHLAADLGVAEAIEILLISGADVTLQDKLGDTPVHTLIRRAGEEPSRTDRGKKVLLEILRHAHYQESLRDIYVGCSEVLKNQPVDDIRPYAVILLRMLTNNDGLTPLFFAVEAGSEEMLKLILTLDGAFRLSGLSGSPAKDKHAYYDVTDLVPETVNEELRRGAEVEVPAAVPLVELPPRYQDPDCVAAAAAGGAGGDGRQATRRLTAVKKRLPQLQQRGRRRSSIRAGESLVEFILADVPSRGHLLELTPLNELTVDYWAPYMIVYLALMIVHIVCMALFSWKSLESLRASRQLLSCTATSASGVPPNATAAAGPTSDNSPLSVTLIMIWPLLIVVTDVLSLIGYLRRKYDCRNLAAEARRQLSYVRDTQAPMFWVLGVAFSWVSLAWYALHLSGRCEQDYALCVALITGWLYAIHFTQGARSVHHFALVLGRILMRDIWQFGVVFIFVLLGYSCGFHAMTFAVPTQLTTFARYGTTLFKVFSWGAGMGDFYQETDYDYASAGKSKDFVESVFVTYVIALNIILLNMLIAVMNDSYAAVRERSAASWRLGSLRRAVSFERHYASIARLVRRWRKRDIAVDAQWPSRFYLKVAEHDRVGAASYAAQREEAAALTQALTQRLVAAVDKAVDALGGGDGGDGVCGGGLATVQRRHGTAPVEDAAERSVAVSAYLGRSNLAIDRSSAYQRSAWA